MTRSVIFPDDLEMENDIRSRHKMSCPEHRETKGAASEPGTMPAVRARYSGFCEYVRLPRGEAMRAGCWR